MTDGQPVKMCVYIYIFFFLLLCHAITWTAHKGLQDTIINTQTDQKTNIDAKQYEQQRYINQDIFLMLLRAPIHLKEPCVFSLSLSHSLTHSLTHSPPQVWTWCWTPWLRRSSRPAWGVWRATAASWRSGSTTCPTTPPSVSTYTTTTTNTTKVDAKGQC